MRPALCFGLGSALVIVVVIAVQQSFLKPSQAHADSDIRSPIPDGYVDPDQLREYHDLTTRQQAAMSRCVMKQDVAAALIRGELTFSEAAAQFREITLADPSGLANLRRAYPDVTDEELHYRNVIGAVRGLLGREPERLAELVRRLEADLRARFAATANRNPAT